MAMASNQHDSATVAARQRGFVRRRYFKSARVLAFCRASTSYTGKPE
jgi:hypothetical protein